ncbi:hypothetical protein [Cereibacter johrii]|uniref:hypothetical protein n=1 Tax=Cereibacter johrii TaxID=445629 RepID=UPI000DCD421B|nr:hypothetical protein [Cereibacter johrii]RAZ83416.1 hypothetical protein DDV93_13980 [Cereibacter johrii]
MPSLKDFVDALKAGWFPALAAFVGCAIVVLGDYYQLPYLDEIPKFILNVAVIVGVFSFSILSANVARVPVAIWKLIRNRRYARMFKEKIISEIKAAPKAEEEILSYLVTSGRKAFVAKIDNRRLMPLVAKGILVRLTGTHSSLAWPYVVRDEAWEYLTQNRERYYYEDRFGTRDPFDWRNEYF